MVFGIFTVRTPAYFDAVDLATICVHCVHLFPRSEDRCFRYCCLFNSASIFLSNPVEVLGASCLVHGTLHYR